MKRLVSFLVVAALVLVVLWGYTYLAIQLMKGLVKKPAKVKLGNEIFIAEHLDLVKGKRVGLFTNLTGVDSELVSLIDVFYQHPDIKLVALFGPEHGVRGNYAGGEKVEHGKDKRTGIPIYSLYQKSDKEIAEILSNVDVIVFDIQDVGARSYTYIWSMIDTMKATEKCNKRFIVLDRPNPIGGLAVEGNILDPDFKSGIGKEGIPYIHGMTIGELAKMFNEHFGIGCELYVIKMEGWKREMTFKDTGLPWVPTSPHIPEPDTPFFYPLTGILGELREEVSIGVGYTLPFKIVGAPYIKAQEFTDYLNAKNLPGVTFSPIWFQQKYGVFSKENEKGEIPVCEGTLIHITDYKMVRPCATGIHIMAALRDLYGLNFSTTEENKERMSMFDKAAGTDQLRKDLIAGKPAEEIIANWQKNLEPFLKIRKKYLLY